MAMVHSLRVMEMAAATRLTESTETIDFYLKELGIEMPSVVSGCGLNVHQLKKKELR